MFLQKDRMSTDEDDRLDRESSGFGDEVWSRC